MFSGGLPLGLIPLLSMQTYEQFTKKMAGNAKFNKMTKAQKHSLYNRWKASAAGKVANRPPPKKSSAPNSKAMGAYLGEKAGAYLPGPLQMFSPLAGQLGGMLGEKVGTLLGLGEYKVSRNSVQTRIVSEGTTPANMHSSKAGFVLRHREYLGDLYSASTAGAFSVQNYPLQPGLTSVFPWCAIIAGSFQEWTPRGVVFEFKSNTGLISSAATPAVGMVIMATDYDSYNTQPFDNKIDMENTVYTTSAKSTESFYHPIECAPRHNVLDRLFLRQGPVPPNQPPQLYDLGTFAIASVGQPVANQNLGEIWVTYDIEFSKATMRNHHNSSIQSDIFNAQDDGSAGPALFGEFVAGPENSIGGTVAKNGTDVSYTFPQLTSAGTYDFYVQLEGAGAAAMGGTMTTTLVNCQDASAGWNSVAVPASPAFWMAYLIIYGSAIASSVSKTLCFRLKVTGSFASMTLHLSGFTWPTSIDAGWMVVNKSNADLSPPSSGPPAHPPLGFEPEGTRPSTEMATVRAVAGRVSASEREELRLLRAQLTALTSTTTTSADG